MSKILLINTGKTQFIEGSLNWVKDGSYMFYGCLYLTSFNTDLSNLTNGEKMFMICSNLTSFNADLSNLVNGEYMFYECRYLTSFNSDLSSLTNGDQMFYGCDNLTLVKSDLSSLTDGSSMFGRCGNLTSFNADLSSLTDGSGMFSGCKLDAPSVEKILTTIPVYSDGSSHYLQMTVQSGEAAAKFNEITGTPPTSTLTYINFKGWRIGAGISN